MQQKRHIRFDWAIKRLLRQKANFGILEGFLSELLKEDIRIIEILDSESNKETAQDKFNRVDILVKDSKGALIIIEVQNSYAIDYFMRILFGISKAVVEYIKEGDTYSKVKKIISVNIVYFELGRGDDYVYRGVNCFRGIHSNDVLELTPAQKRLFKKEKVEDIYPEIYLLKVNNFDDNAKDTLDEWIYFLKNSEIKQEFSAKGIKEANEVLKRANMSDEERREYQRFVEVLSDNASAAATIEFEAKLLAEKKVKARIKQAKKEIEEEKRKVEEEKRKVEEEKLRADKAERKIIGMIKRLLELGTLSEEEIAALAGVDAKYVREIKNT